jgi:hypothetical protein
MINSLSSIFHIAYTLKSFDLLFMNFSTINLGMNVETILQSLTLRVSDFIGLDFTQLYCAVLSILRSGFDPVPFADIRTEYMCGIVRILSYGASPSLPPSLPQFS